MGEKLSVSLLDYLCLRVVLPFIIYICLSVYFAKDKVFISLSLSLSEAGISMIGIKKL